MATNKVKQKSFNVKVYNLAGTFLRSINPLDIMTGIAFTSQINGGQGELRVKIRATIASGIIAYNNIIRVYESDTVTPTPRLIYSGIVWSLQRISEGTGDFIEIRAVGLASMLSWLFFQSASNYIFSKTQDLTLTMQDIITSFSVTYPGIISYVNGVTTENTGISSTLSFSYDKDNAALKKVSDTATYWWHIDSAGLLQYHPKVGAIGQLNHKFTFGKDIDNISIDENVEQMANRAIVKWSGGIVTANDATSQTANGIREFYEDQSTAITDSTTANTRASSQLANRKDLKRKISIQINDSFTNILYAAWVDSETWVDTDNWVEVLGTYGIEYISPGDIASIVNSDYSITALQIQKIEYNTDYIRIELEDINSFTNELFS